MTILGLLKTKAFWNKASDIIVSFHGVTYKILSCDLNYIADHIAQVKIFCFVEKLCSVFWDIQAFVYHTMLYQICDVIMSISTWDKVHFLIHLLNNNSLTHHIWSIDRYKQEQYFSEIF